MRHGFAEGRSADTHIHDVLTERVLYCLEDEDVAANMAYDQGRRSPVLAREKRLVGILAALDRGKQAFVSAH